MLLLFETPAGYSLFKVKDEDKLKDIDVRLFFVIIIRVVGFFFSSSRVKEKGIADFSLCVSSRRQFSLNEGN